MEVRCRGLSLRVGGFGQGTPKDAAEFPRRPVAEMVKVHIIDGSDIQGNDLREDQSSRHADADGAAHVRSGGSHADGQRQSAHNRGQSGHENGAEADEASLDYCLFGSKMFLPFCFQ